MEVNLPFRPGCVGKVAVMTVSVVARGDAYGVAVAGKFIALGSVAPRPRFSIDNRTLQNLREADA